MIKTVSCPVCRSCNIEFLYRVHKTVYHKCKHCGAYFSVKDEKKDKILNSKNRLLKR